MDKGFNGIIVLGFTKEKSLSKILSEESEKEEEFVKLSTYEKLEEELNKAYEEISGLKSNVTGLLNHIDMLQSENKILIAENREIAKSLSSVSVALAEMNSKK